MRILSAGALAALDSGQFATRNGFAVYMPAGTFALWDDVSDVTIDGVPFLAGSGVFRMAPVPSASDLGVRALDVVLSGIDARVAAQVRNEPWHQRPVAAWRFVIAIDQPAVIHAKQWFAGYLDTLEIKEKPDGMSDIMAKCEDAGRELSRKGARTRSATDQRQLASDDAFFDATVAAVNTEIIWGQAAQPAPAQKPRKLFGIF